jgi:hypothetical protein
MKAWMIAAMIAPMIAASLVATAAAQPVQEWPVAIQPAPENAATCNPGGSDGKIQVKDGSMALVFTRFPEPIWTIKLADDGSFDAIAQTLADSKGTKITVPKGSGPREIVTMQQSQTCGYRMIPA